MKCIYCGELIPGFSKLHKKCKEQVNKTIAELDAMLEMNMPHNEKRRKLINIAMSDIKFQNYMHHETNRVFNGEILLFVVGRFQIWEQKNTCTMQQRTLSYAKDPVWQVEKINLTYANAGGSVFFADKIIHLSSRNGTISYPYSKIVNIESEGRDVYFDIRTSSPYPHRFFLSPFRMFDRDNKDNRTKVHKILELMTGRRCSPV